VTQAREWAATCTIFAEDNQNLLPTNFDQINYFFPSLSPTSSTNWEIASGGNLNSFTNPHQNMLTILLREKESRQSPDGTFVKAYAFVDGHVQQLSSSNNDFTAMEKQRGFLVKPGKNVRE